MTEFEPDPFVERLAAADEYARAASRLLAYAQAQAESGNTDVAATYGLLGIARSLQELVLRMQVGGGDPMSAVPTTAEMPTAGGV